MSWRLTISTCLSALAAASCTTGQINADGSPLPTTTHADLIFVGRILSSEPVDILNVDTFHSGWRRTFEALDQPGSKVVAIDDVCPDEVRESEALLIFLEGRTAAKRRPEDREYFVYACPVVDAQTRWLLSRYENCFGPEAAELKCFD